MKNVIVLTILAIGGWCVGTSHIPYKEKPMALQSSPVQMKAGTLATSDLLTLLGYTNTNVQSLTITQFEVLVLKGANSITKTVVGKAFTDDIRAIFRQLDPGHKAIIQKVKARNGKLEARVKPVSITII